MSCLPPPPPHEPAGGGLFRLDDGRLVPSVTLLARWALRMEGEGGGPPFRARLRAMRNGASLHGYLNLVARRKTSGLPSWAISLNRWLRRWGDLRWHAETTLVAAGPRPLLGRPDLLGVGGAGAVVVDVKTGSVRLRDMLQSALYTCLVSSVLHRPVLSSYIVSVQGERITALQVRQEWERAARGVLALWHLCHDTQGEQRKAWERVEVVTR